ncbi:uncharacterized protein LOC135922664 [Gordionus sp. m RMFG-2023]|uniref:uncharacterized protein LOC135922664 n=1 Tax=Gordionus sp. m RMFG-2023 TaxID=3053472 RepID=UPI0031FD90C1
MTLETLIMQPGIKPSMIMVAYDELVPVFKDITELFGAKPHHISSSFNYNELFHKALQQAWAHYSKCKKDNHTKRREYQGNSSQGEGGIIIHYPPFLITIYFLEDLF